MKHSDVRIISLAPSNTEILYRIGAGEDIIATTSLCDHPEKAMTRPGIGGWVNPDHGKIRELGPDIVIASDDLQDNAVKKMKDEDFEILQVRPHTVEEIFESITEIGAAVGREEEARELVEEIKIELKQLEFDGSPRIYCEEWSNPPMASGNWIPGLVEQAGGEYFIDEGERSSEFDLDNLKQFDPEFIFLNVCGAGDSIDRKEIMDRPEWQSITAVENGDVYVIDDSLLNRPGPRIVDGLKQMVEFSR